MLPLQFSVRMKAVSKHVHMLFRPVAKIIFFCVIYLLIHFFFKIESAFILSVKSLPRVAMLVIHICLFV